MATIKKFEELDVWKMARQLAHKIYELTEKGKFVKDFGFKDQIKRAAGSVMDNIAEGFGRGGNREFTNHLSISIGSCNEVQSQLYRALDWKYIDENEFNGSYALSEAIISKSGRLISYLNTSNVTGEKFKNRKPQTTNNKPQTA